MLKKQRKKEKIIAFFFLLFLPIKLLFSCYYNNYFPNKEITCISGRDYNVFNLEDNLSLESYTPYSLGFNKLILAKKNGKNVLIAIKYNIVDSEVPKKWNSIFYFYDSQQKKFEYLGTFQNGFISDVNNNSNYEIVFQNFLTNQLIIKEDTLNSFDLRKNETLYWVKDSYIVTYLNINETNFNLTFYRYNGNGLIKNLELNLEKSKFQDLFIYKDNIYILYDGYWYLVNSQNKEEWENQVGYLRLTKYNSFVVNQLTTKYVSVLDLSLTKELGFEFNQDPLFTITSFNGEEYVFLLDNSEKELYIYDKNKKLIKTFTNVSYFSVNNQKLFLVKDSKLYITSNFYNLYLFFNDSTNKIKEVYLYDYDNDGKSEIEILLNDGEVYLYNEQTKPDIDYYLKKINFPEPYITYSKYFNITICSKGSQIIPFNLSILIENNNTKIPVEKEFLSQILGANTCKTYTIDYIPFKTGVVTINVSLKVNDKNILNNYYSTKKEVVHDYWFVDKVFNATGFLRKNEGFLMIDEDDNLLNGYEKFEFVNLTNCSYKKVDYNNDGTREYLVDCDYDDNYKLLDPLNKKIYDVKEAKDEDFDFFIGLINDTHFSVILPWNNYTGYVASITKDQFGDLLKIDYNLDNIEDFLTYKSAFSIYGKQLTDFSYLTTNLRIKNPTILINLNNNSFLVTLNFNLEYKGLFNESGKIKINYLGEEVTIPISNNYSLINKIPIQQTPLTAFSSLPLSFELKNEKFNDFKIYLDYKKQYNKTDDEISLNYCDLSINNVDLKNSYIEINKSGQCSEKVHLVVKNEKNLIILDTYIDNNTDRYYFEGLPISKNYYFYIYQDNILDKNYLNNKVSLDYEVTKLIHIDFQTENILLYNPNNIEFNVKCDKNMALDLKLNCDFFNKTESFECNSNGKNFSYNIIPFEKFKCLITLKNEDLNITIKKNIGFNFEFPKALEKLKLGKETITIIEINGEKKALLGKELKDVNVVNVDKDNFQSILTGEDNALNIYNVELPNYLKFVKVEADQPVKVDKKGNKIIIKTFASKIKIITKSLEKLNENEKKKLGVTEETEVVKNNESFSKIIKLIALLIFFLSLITTIILSAYYYYKHVYLKKKKILEEQKKMGYYYKLHKQKEARLLKKQKEELEKRKEAVILEEAKKLVSWVKFLLETYDEKEIYNYLLRKGYKKEVVDKAFELIKKGKF